MNDSFLPLKYKKLKSKLQYFRDEHREVDTIFVDSLGVFYKEFGKFYNQDGTSKEEASIVSDIKYDIPKEEVNKIFRLIANKTHPDKLINKKISDKEYEEKVTTYKEANTACDNRDWFKLKEIAKELKIETKKNLAGDIIYLEKSITEVESKINNIKNTYPWIWYHIEENQKEFVKPQIIEALKEKSKFDHSDDVS